MARMVTWDGEAEFRMPLKIPKNQMFLDDVLFLDHSLPSLRKEMVWSLVWTTLWSVSCWSLNDPFFVRWRPSTLYEAIEYHSLQTTAYIIHTSANFNPKYVQWFHTPPCSIWWKNLQNPTSFRSLWEERTSDFCRFQWMKEQLKRLCYKQSIVFAVFELTLASNERTHATVLSHSLRSTY